jgi:hypothetical protein
MPDLRSNIMTVCNNVFWCSYPFGLATVDLFPAHFVRACSQMESEGLIPVPVFINGVN